MEARDIEVVKAFIAAINRGDTAELSRLMTEDHSLIDSTGRIESGRENIKTGVRS